jgi:hypothetical protein
VKKNNGFFLQENERPLPKPVEGLNNMFNHTHAKPKGKGTSAQAGSPPVPGHQREFQDREINPFFPSPVFNSTFLEMNHTMFYSKLGQSLDLPRLGTVHSIQGGLGPLPQARRYFHAGEFGKF